MKFAKPLIITSALFIPFSTGTAHELSSEEEAACGALLCLVGGASYPECDPYLRRYYSIDDDDRDDFLKKCSLIDADEQALAAHQREIDTIVRYGSSCQPSVLVNYLNEQIEACEKERPVTGADCTPRGDEWKVCINYHSSSYVGYKPPTLIRECKSDPYYPSGKRCKYRWVLSRSGG